MLMNNVKYQSYFRFKFGAEPNVRQLSYRPGHELTFNF